MTVKAIFSGGVANGIRLGIRDNIQMVTFPLHPESGEIWKLSQGDPAGTVDLVKAYYQRTKYKRDGWLIFEFCGLGR